MHRECATVRARNVRSFADRPAKSRASAWTHLLRKRYPAALLIPSRRRQRMQRFQRFALVGCLLFVPTLAHAQASIGGVVKDSSGAVLPGVTVEASSPA